MPMTLQSFAASLLFCLLAASAYRVKPRGSSVFRARMEAVNQEQPNFPGPHAKVRTGIAFSGGGCRAMSWAVGVLRALDGLGLMDRMDAVSTVSGGGWAAAPYMFANMTSTQLLGSFTDPGQLTLKTLNTTNGVLTEALNTRTVALFAQYQLLYPSHEAWERLVATVIMEPFGLGNRSRYMAASPEHLAQIRRANPQLQPDQFDLPRPGRPPAFIMNGLLAAPSGLHTERNRLVSLQMSPDFTGSPFWANYNGSLQRINYSSKLGFTTMTDVARGGGFVETFAFGSDAPTDGQSGSRMVQVRSPVVPLSLPAAVGISSAMWFWPRRKVWPVLPDGVAPQAAIEHEIADGGLNENAGVLPLIQRGATRVITVISTAIPMAREVDFCVPRSEEEWETMTTAGDKVPRSLVALFGFTYNSFVSSYDTSQVFARSDLPAVLCDLQNLKKSGKPTVTSASLRVQENTWWGIQGGFDIELCVVLLDVCTDFEQSLAAETQQALKTEARFADHPHYGTFSNTDPIYFQRDQANILASQAEYFVRQNEGLFRQLLSS